MEADEVLAAYERARNETTMSLEEFNQSMDEILAELAAADVDKDTKPTTGEPDDAEPRRPG